MSLAQLIYTSTCIDGMTPRLSHEVSLKSVKICQQLNITGRVFANDFQALAITEGPADVVSRYYAAVRDDSLVENIILHVERPISAREFSDYSVWLNSSESFYYGTQVRKLTPQTLSEALPDNLSSKIRIMIEAYIKPELMTV